MPALELDAIEARVLGVLIEKELTTPEQYPLSLNALVAGANQKSNRDPVLELRDGDVTAAIERLRRKSLVGASHASGARTERYKHAAATVWQLTPQEIAIMAELLMRGPQMPGELRGRADRMSRIETLESLGTLLENLRQKGFVRRLEPLPGARAPQWEQIVAERTLHAPGATARVAALMSGETSASLASASPSRASTSPSGASASPSAGSTASRAPSTSTSAAGAPSSVASVQQTPAPTPSRSLEARVAALEAEVARLARLYEGLA